MIQSTWSPQVAWPAEILLHLPDDGRRYELVDGVLVGEMMTAPQHGGICNRVGWALTNYVYQYGSQHAVVQNTLFDLTASGAIQRTVLALDVALMRGVATPPTIPVESPFLAVEVVSPSQTLQELRDKTQIYLAAGTDEVWIIDPATRTIEIWNSQGTMALGDQQALTSVILPGFSASVAWVLDG